jgi:hypothetical protein
VDPEPDLFGLGDEQRHGIAQLAVLRDVIGDNSASPATKVDEPLLAKELIGTQHRVHIDVEGGGDLSGGWQALARTNRSFHRIESYGCCELFE